MESSLPPGERSGRARQRARWRPGGVGSGPQVGTGPSRAAHRDHVDPRPVSAQRGAHDVVRPPTLSSLADVLWRRDALSSSSRARSGWIVIASIPTFSHNSTEAGSMGLLFVAFGAPRCARLEPVTGPQGGANRGVDASRREGRCNHTLETVAPVQRLFGARCARSSPAHPRPRWVRASRTGRSNRPRASSATVAPLGWTPRLNGIGGQRGEHSRWAP